MPLAVDMFCGLGGWTDGLLAEGWDVIGFDIERHQYGEHRYPAQLVVQDVLTLHGSQFSEADLIVASPPCQAYSWMAMPWTLAKAKAAAIRADETGQMLADLNRLFDACFRLQREACEAAGRHIPMVVENVRGAIPWVGRSRWHFGSYYLWGDVPALMPMTFNGTKVTGVRSWSDFGKPDYKPMAFNGTAEKRWIEGQKVPGFRFDGSGQSFQSASVKETGIKNGGDWFGSGADCSLQRHFSGTKRPGVKLSEVGFNVSIAREVADELRDTKYERSDDDKRQHLGINRKAASAMIAKIPLPLSRHIARWYLNEGGGNLSREEKSRLRVAAPLLF